MQRTWRHMQLELQCSSNTKRSTTMQIRPELIMPPRTKAPNYLVLRGNLYEPFRLTMHFYCRFYCPNPAILPLFLFLPPFPYFSSRRSGRWVLNGPCIRWLFRFKWIPCKKKSHWCNCSDRSAGARLCGGIELRDLLFSLDILYIFRKWLKRERTDGYFVTRMFLFHGSFMF